MGFFPMDDIAIQYMRTTGRDDSRIAFTEAYLKAQGLFRDYKNDKVEPTFTDVLELDLSTIKPALSGPKRPHDLVNLSDMKKDFLSVCYSLNDLTLVSALRTRWDLKALDLVRPNARRLSALHLKMGRRTS